MLPLERRAAVRVEIRDLSVVPDRDVIVSTFIYVMYFPSAKRTVPALLMDTVRSKLLRKWISSEVSLLLKSAIASSCAKKRFS